MKVFNSVHDFIDEHLIPMFLQKLGKGWRKNVKLGADPKTSKTYVRFVDMTRAAFSQVRDALFSMARSLGVHMTADSHNMKLMMVIRPA